MATLLGAAALNWPLGAAATTYFSTEEAQRALFPSAQFAPVDIAMDRDFLKEVKSRTTMSLKPGKVQIWRVRAADREMGWFFVADVLGKHEDIRYALALDPGGAVKGVEVMEYRETHGDEVKERDWLAQFLGKQLGDDLKLGRGIDAISGATLSCRHLSDGVHGLLMVHDRYLKAP